jgi:hypothetical protein
MKCCRHGCLITLIIIYLLYEYFLAYDFTRIFYLIIQPKDIKVPLVKEEFQFDKEGYEREYRISPKYRGVHYILIDLEGYAIEREKLEKCKGELEIIYYRKDKIIKKKIINELKGYLYTLQYGNGDQFKSIRLDKFDYYNSIFRWDIDRIVLKVNKPMTCFPKGKYKKTYLVIRYSYDL